MEEWEVGRLSVGKEVGENGTPHLQGAVTFKTPKRLKGVKKLLERAHWEPMIGKDTGFAYTQKDGDMLYNINNSKQGKRTDIEIAYSLLEKRASAEEVYEARLPYQALKTYELAKKYRPEDSIKDIEVIWNWGESGTGKTYAAIAEGAHMMEYTNGFWSSYSGEKHILLDDIHPKDIPAKMLLKALDKYTFPMNTVGTSIYRHPFRGKSIGASGKFREKGVAVKKRRYGIKGSGDRATWTTVTVTTTRSPEEFWSYYDSAAGPKEQLLRRITHTRKFEIEL